MRTSPNMATPARSTIQRAAPRTTRPQSCLPWLLFTVLSLTGANAWSQVEHFRTINVPGSSLTRINDINNLNVMVGRFDDANGVHGFVFDHGVYTTIDHPGSNFTTLIGINDADDLCGRYVDRGGHDRGFVLRGGTFTAVDVPGAVHTQCHGINSQGQVAGRYIDWRVGPGGHRRQVEHGFLLSDGVYTSVDYPTKGEDTTDAWKINDAGKIAGDWSTKGTLESGSLHGYVLLDGSYTSIDVPAAVITASREVNARGVMVGIYWDNQFLDRAFVRAHGRCWRYEYPGSVETDGNAINDRGMVVGSYWDTDGNEHGYIARFEEN